MFADLFSGLLGEGQQEKCGKVSEEASVVLIGDSDMAV